jgi:hypothetical protein
MKSHTSGRRLLPFGVACLALLSVLSGCAKPVPGGGGSGPGPRTYAPDEVVLRVDIVDGFVPAEFVVTRLPIISVYGDGRVITEGPVITIYPGPALPNILVRTISMAGVDALVRRALASGVGRDTDLGQPPVADAPSTRFTVLTDAGSQVTQVNALGIGDEDYGLTAEQRSARRALRDLLNDLADLPGTLGPDAAGAQRPYEPDAVAAVSQAWTDPGSTDIPAQPERAWPGPTLPGESMGNRPGLGCVMVTGTGAATVLAAATSANVLTPWTSDGHRWLVRFRPLLPEETSCADLT